MDLTLSSKSVSFQLILIYRPPPNSKNKLTNAIFMFDFASLLESVTAFPNKLIIAGDFNMHIDIADNSTPSTFRTLHFSFSLEQNVTSPTHHAC